MDIEALFRALQTSAVATTIRENESLFPWIESIHVLAITLVVGCIAIVDLRLIGAAWRDRGLARLTTDVLPCTWVAFAVAAVSGGLLFASNAMAYLQNFSFQMKLVMLALAGFNMLAFHLVIARDMAAWEANPAATPPAARAAGVISLLLWFGVVVFGRVVGFTLVPTPVAG